MSAPTTPGPSIERLTAAVAQARAAAVDEATLDLGAAAASTAVGEHLRAVAETVDSVTHFFVADQVGYRGWQWAVTVACPAPDEPITISEVVLVPGADALVAPAWVPWEERIRPGDLGIGDLLPPREDDLRLVPGYLGSDDPALAELAFEVGLGREQVLSREGREEAAQRWHDGEFGPASDRARQAPAPCGTCGFFLPLAGSLRAAFGACGNEYSPADGAVVEVGFGCGAHSSVVVEQASPVLVGELVYDDGVDLVVPRPQASTADDREPVTS